MGTDELTGRALSTLHGKTRVVILLMGVSGSGKQPWAAVLRLDLVVHY